MDIMKLEEIWVNPPRDEFLDDKQYNFSQATPVAKIKNLTLKKVSKGDDIFYGLFDNNNQLVGYLKITKYDTNWYQVCLSQLAQTYKGQGYGTFLYTYCVLNDKTYLLSDNDLTKHSLQLWMNIRSSGQFIVKVFDKENDRLIDDFSVLENNTRYLLAGLPTGQTINETLEERNNKYNGDRYIVWYGPGTTNETYFNY
jgi:hypothetical protein